uniref:Somatostatin/Cortistatin C-terminal domain-containing protein n=1 Tax=Callorhinchus milii TaxID=7868 RepID=A0A4W3HDQ2_CALMI
MASFCAVRDCVHSVIGRCYSCYEPLSLSCVVWPPAGDFALTACLQELRDGVVRELIQAVADAESKPQSEEAAEDFAPDEKAELRLALAPRWRKDCKNFFWKTYTLC